MPAPDVLARRFRGAIAVTVVLAMALLIAMFDIVPVQSQAVRLEVVPASGEVPVDEPWASIWDEARLRTVPLSAQNIAPPFGGGTVESLTARALHDGQRLYLSIEWADAEIDDSVTGQQDFSDAAAVQFPATDATTPYTMGGPDAPVNIWQWKAVWQRDIDEGFSTSGTLYPNTFTDFYPSGEDDLYNPARRVGNQLAIAEHKSPIEDLIAEGFGTLTPAVVQNVTGSGEWRDGRWRALFVRDLAVAVDGLARFDPGGASLVAFAIWDGGSGDRNGQKSIAQFIELGFGSGVPAPVPTGDGGGASPWPAFFTFLGIMAAIALAGEVALRIGRRRA